MFSMRAVQYENNGVKNLSSKSAHSKRGFALLNVKRRKMVFTLIMVIFAATFLATCFSACKYGKELSEGRNGQNELTDSQILDNLFGNYEFEEAIYVWPLSSFLPVKESVPDYMIGEYAFIIEYDEPEIYPLASYERKPVAEDEFGENLDFNRSIDISGYRKKLRYDINAEDGSSTKHRIYLMDEEVWLATCTGDPEQVCYIYLLKKKEPKDPADAAPVDVDPVIGQHAWDLIKMDIEIYENEDTPRQGPEPVKIIDAKITRLACAERYDDILENSIELWLLEYRLLPDNIGNILLAGGSTEENGWITEIGSIGQPYLIIEQSKTGPVFRGYTNTLSFQEDGGIKNAVINALSQTGE